MLLSLSLSLSLSLPLSLFVFLSLFRCCTHWVVIVYSTNEVIELSRNITLEDTCLENVLRLLDYCDY